MDIDRDKLWNLTFFSIGWPCITEKICVIDDEMCTLHVTSISKTEWSHLIEDMYNDLGEVDHPDIVFAKATQGLKHHVVLS